MSVVRDIEPWDQLLEAGREDERLVMQTAQNPRPPQEIAIPGELHTEVADALRERGIDRLWAHQAEALHAAAPDSKTIRWYDAGHGLNLQAAWDRHDWLHEKIGLDAR